MTAVQLDAEGAAPPGGRASRTNLTKGAGIGLGVVVLWFSVLVLLPLAAVVAVAVNGGWDGFVSTLTNPQTASAIKLTVLTSLAVAVLNVLVGTLIAWVLVRERFPGSRVLEVVIDVPFALPTIVAGLTLLALYGPRGAFGVNLAYTRAAVMLALLFVTLPFVVRSVQPVLEQLDREAEQAAHSLGASPGTTFRRIVLPALIPAIAAGGALSFARGVSEYGSLVLLSGNLAMRTEVTSVRMLTYVENGNLASASVVATVLLGVALFVLVAIDLLQRWLVRRG